MCHPNHRFNVSDGYHSWGGGRVEAMGGGGGEEAWGREEACRAGWEGEKETQGARQRKPDRRPRHCRGQRNRMTLGTRAQIPTGYIVKILRAQSTCNSNMPSDQMLSTFWIYSAMYPRYAQWAHTEYILNVPSHLTPMYPVGKQLGTFSIFTKI